MSVWRWFRARRWWLQVIIGAVVVPVLAVLLYVAVRSFQYASSDKDAGAYVPSTANVVVRSRGLEHHLERIRESTAWRVIERKILKDPVLRREINGLLQGSGAPTLDDLEDERKPFAKNLPRGIQAIGADAIAALQVRESVATAPYCAIVRLRWLHFLATPFASFVLPTEPVGGETCLLIRQDRQEIRVAFTGALAIVSNSKPLLEEALRRRGREEESGRPLEARVTFEKSPGLMKIRQAVQDLGAFPYVKWPTVRGVSLTADVADATLKVDALFDRAEAVHETGPPIAIRLWAPVATSGVLLTNTGGADLIGWVRSLIGKPGPNDFVARTGQEALQALDDGGLTSTFLPQLQDGMAVLTGVEEREGRAYTAFALILPARDPKAAVEAMNGLVKKIAGSFGDSKYFTEEPVAGTTMYSWTWPRSLQINDLLSPTYAAVKDVFVMGNNKAFTEAILRAAEQGGGFEETSAWRKLRSGLKEQGFAADPPLAGGFLFPPLFRESMDGSLTHAAKQIVYLNMNGPALRSEVIADLRRSGRQPTEEEIGRAFNEAIDRKIQEEEADLRRLVRPLDSMRWMAFEAAPSPKGIVFRLALEFR